MAVLTERGKKWKLEKSGSVDMLLFSSHSPLFLLLNDFYLYLLIIISLCFSPGLFVYLSAELKKTSRRIFTLGGGVYGPK